MENKSPIFRAKNLKGEWIEGDLIHNRGEVFIAPVGIANPLAKAEDFQVDENTVGQHVYLLDQYGRKAFVGDIFLDEMEKEQIIRLSHGGFVYGDDEIKSLSNEENALLFPKTCTIIGSIHDAG
jgi:hypothetical protein